MASIEVPAPGACVPVSFSISSVTAPASVPATVWLSATQNTSIGCRAVKKGKLVPNIVLVTEP